MSTGFSFGGKTTAQAFGGTNTLSFGAQPITSQFNVGSMPQQQATGFQLGSTFAKPTGSVAPQVASVGFGATTSTPGASFGATAFGIPSTAPTSSSSFGLGTNISSTAPGLSFGLPSSLGAGFGVPQTSATNLSLTASSGTTALNFGVAAPNFSSGAPSASFGTPTTALNLSGTNTGLSLAGTTSSAAGAAATFSLRGLTAPAAPTPALNFGTSTTGSILTSTPSTGLTFGVTPSLNFGLPTTASGAPGGLAFGPPVASTGLNLTSGGTSSAPTPSTKVGLGGIQTSTAASLGKSTAKEIPPKEQQIPNEIQQDIENFKNYIKQQKLYSSDVSRCCVKDFRSVEAQIGVLNNVIKEIESQLQRNRGLAEKLKYDTAQGLQLLEMAQRTQDTPAGLQYENVAPMNYFLNLADNFEKEMHTLRIQIENTDKYVKNFGQPATLTSQDLCLGMKRLHDTFVALAGRLQSVHTQVESQKELYTNLRKQLSNDFSNPFESLDKPVSSNRTIPTPTVNHSPPKIACGPTPFDQIISNSPVPSRQNTSSMYPGMSSINSGFGSATLPNLFGNNMASSKTNLSFPNTNLGSTMGFQNTSLGSAFQLQKPPTGNKRGKP